MNSDPTLPGPGSPPTASGSPRDRIVDALMRLAAEQPWDDIEIGDVAREAGLSLSGFRDHFPSKGAVLAAFARRIDKIVIEGTTDDLTGEPIRERIFDVMMRRIDALAPYKRALRRIAFAFRSDPLSLIALNQVALNSQRFMLAAAGVPVEGPLGRLKVQGAVFAFNGALETWLADDDPALARTMARLDRELRRGERMLERADDVRRLTAPFRALGRALFDRGTGRARRRRGGWGERERDEDGESRDPAAAI